MKQPRLKINAGMKEALRSEKTRRGVPMAAIVADAISDSKASAFRHTGEIVQAPHTYVTVSETVMKTTQTLADGRSTSPARAVQSALREYFAASDREIRYPAEPVSDKAPNKLPTVAIRVRRDCHGYVAEYAEAHGVSIASVVEDALDLHRSQLLGTTVPIGGMRKCMAEARKALDRAESLFQESRLTE